MANGYDRLILAILIGCSTEFSTEAVEKQVTSAQQGHILTNSGVWSPDSEWIVYDVRSDPMGEKFDGTRIERVSASTGEVQLLYRSRQGAHCGVATCCPSTDRIVMIHGPELPSDQWSYAAYHRRGVIVDSTRPLVATNLDARNLHPPFTPGALRGGTHLHTFSGDGTCVAFTYEDHVLAEKHGLPDAELNQRNVGVSIAGKPVAVPSDHPRNHEGSHFSVLVTQTADHPLPGSDEIARAYSNAWVGNDGYLRTDGSRQAKAIALLGDVQTSVRETISEVFLVDLPDDLTIPSDHPLAGTSITRPYPPRGVKQRRLTFTADRKFPGVQGVRHWVVSSPDGAQIGCLMRDDAGVVQFWTVSPGADTTEHDSLKQITNNRHDVQSAFSWSPDGSHVYFVMDRSICRTDVTTGQTIRLTDPNDESPVSPLACVISPDGSKVAYVRRVDSNDTTWNQIFTVDAR